MTEAQKRLIERCAAHCEKHLRFAFEADRLGDWDMASMHFYGAEHASRRAFAVARAQR